MKAIAAFCTRLLAFTLLVMIAGILLIESESPPKTVIGGDGFQSAGTLTPVYAAPVQVKLVDLIPASLSGEINQDSEPFLALVRPRDGFETATIDSEGRASFPLPLDESVLLIQDDEVWEIRLSFQNDSGATTGTTTRTCRA